ncbi:MAG: hypothetical protein IAE77_03210 [Prosthecobacter sp.]|jgi:hypothetical protein|uniref:hypothetical protein n=1 Tax=Prosthecobacter sp. TaxID=1965333 RepID=UPI001A0960AB|nr:hypothetical protein [Prosthecobacter sp.]MBE2282454.1 hypothetical protein [Prosthecobacter sp.]
MKSLLKYSAIALALFTAQQTSAVDIVVTGSTAFRSSTHNAIINMMGGAPSVRIAHSHASSLSSANQSTFKGSIPGITGDVYVFCSWSGSATGVIAVAGTTPVSVVPAATVDAVTLGTTQAGAAASTTKTPRIAFSDVYKESTSAASASLTNQNMAVIPFRFLRNRVDAGDPNGNNAAIAQFTNVTAQHFRAVYGNSSQPLSLFTGDPNHFTLVLPMGRDNGSGTRITVMAETKYGIGTPVVQWKGLSTTGSAGSGTLNSAQIWAVGDGTGSTLAGNGGYSSGGTLVTNLGLTSNNFTGYDSDGVTEAIGPGEEVIILGYAGLSDASAAITSGAIALKYEGFDYSAAAVQNGQYTLWGYLHAYYPTLNADETTFKNAVATQFSNAGTLGSNGITLSSMNVSRQTDGAVVGP